MFLITLIAFVVLLLYSVYCKLTYGINKCSKHLVGKVAILTGGGAGIGFETAKDLAYRGAKVIIADKDIARGTAAREKIIVDTNNIDVSYTYLDLASLASVRKFCNEILKSEKQLDILINNAGVIVPENLKSKDGLSLGMQVNHFGPFLLTNLLLPLLKSSAPSRIINVASTVYRFGKVDFENLNMEKETERTFSFTKLYSNTKLCNVLITMELARILDGTGVTANCLHPGSVRTSILEEMENHQPWVKCLQITRFVSRSAWEGAQTTIYLASSPNVSSKSGCYFTECQEQRTTEAARDADVAKKLWEVSEKIVKLT